MGVLESVCSIHHNAVVGAYSEWRRYGTITSDATISHDASGKSERLTPNNASYKLESRSYPIKVPSGSTATVSVWVRESTLAADGVVYGGARPRLVVKANSAIGIAADLAIATAAAPPGGTGWVLLSGTTAALTAAGTLEFVVDCDNTTGWINHDDWTYRTSIPIRNFGTQDIWWQQSIGTIEEEEMEAKGTFGYTAATDTLTPLIHFEHHGTVLDCTACTIDVYDHDATEIVDNAAWGTAPTETAQNAWYAVKAAAGIIAGEAYYALITFTYNAAVYTRLLNFQPGTLANGAIVAGVLGADAITNAKIADDAIAAENIKADAITNAKIADDAIAVENIKDAAITAAKFAAGAIDAAAIKDAAIDAATFAAGAINAAAIADGAIDAATFAAGAITAAAIATDAIDADALAADAIAELATWEVKGSFGYDATSKDLIATVWIEKSGVLQNGTACTIDIYDHDATEIMDNATWDTAPTETAQNTWYAVCLDASALLAAGETYYALVAITVGGTAYTRHLTFSVAA